eukprot:8012606-Lingulodinium_polyedra.AAC.1
MVPQPSSAPVAPAMQETLTLAHEPGSSRSALPHRQVVVLLLHHDVVIPQVLLREAWSSSSCSCRCR